MRQVRKDKIWTVDYLINTLLEDSGDVRDRYFRHMLYRRNNVRRYQTSWEFCKRVSEGDLKALKAWFICTPGERHCIVCRALDFNFVYPEFSTTHFISPDRRIILQ